jgi:hypothetical protein
VMEDIKIQGNIIIMDKLNCNFLFPCVFGRIRTLDFRILSHVFYHCATGEYLKWLTPLRNRVLPTAL